MTFRSGSWLAGPLFAVVSVAVMPPALAQTAECTGNGRISYEIAKPLVGAQDAMKSKDWKKALDKLKDAESRSGTRTAFDKFNISEIRGYVYANLKRDADAARDLEFAYNSPCMPEARKLDRLEALTDVYTRLTDYPKAIAFGERGLTQSRDHNLLIAVALAYDLSGDRANANRLMDEVYDTQQTARENEMAPLKAACDKGDDKACALRKISTTYPKAEYEKALKLAGWKSLFDGKSLDGWTPKIAKHPVGENYADTFRVEDGVIKVYYDKYGKFDRQFGHLYTNQAYSNYILHLEYRFVGTAVEDSPPWAKLNSGVMIHSQSPLSMTLGQEFPASMEFQFLATGASAGKQTGNVCTPGTNLEMGEKLLLDHIIDAKSKFYPLDEWVSVEAEVHGNKEVIYRVNGVEVLRYQRPQLDPRDADAQRLLAAGAPLQLSFGHIALQAESQPVWFRNIRIKQLDE